MDAINNILKSLFEIFDEYSENDEYLSKLALMRFFFENKLIDICEIDIFTINKLFNQLRTEDNKITKENFIKLVLFIYTLQMKPSKNKKENNPIESEHAENIEKESNEYEELPDDLTDMSISSIKSIVTNRKLINSNFNLIKVLMDKIEKDKSYYDLCHPMLNELGMSVFVSDEIIETLEMYHKAIYDNMFYKYVKEESEKNIKYINILDLNQITFDFPIFSTLNSEQISLTVRKYLFPYNFDNESELMKMLESVFEEKQTASSIKNYFNELYLYSSEFNFSFSTFVLILANLAIKYNETINPIESIEYYFSDVLSLIKDKGKEEIIIEESIVSEDSDYLPESKDFMEAQLLLEFPNEEDEIFLQNFLSVLDKEIPEIPLEIISMKNDVAHKSNFLFYNSVKNNSIKFPLEILNSEIEEQKVSKTLDKEKQMINNAKKKQKSNNRDPPSIPQSWYEQVPSKETERLKYFGEKKIYDLKQRFFKNTYKEILPNSNVNPSLINELLIIPKNIPVNVILNIYTNF